MRTLDWRSRHDERSRGYPIREILPPAPLKGRTWPCPVRLDQGQEGACVGYGWSAELAAQPVEVRDITNQYAHDLYKQAQTLDDEPGENYEGTSVLAGAKAVTARGLVSEYRWAFGIDDILAALSHHGTVVLGVTWLDSMFDPVAHGVLDCSGQPAGGHCILARGLLLKPRWSPEPVVRLHQSWGESWGIDGDCFIRASDLEALLKGDGEACVATDSPLR